MVIKKEILNLMIEFVKGEISVHQYWNKINSNKIIKYIQKNKIGKTVFYYYFSEPDKFDISKLYYRVSIFWMTKQYLKLSKINIECKNIDEERMLELNALLPEWVTIYDYEFFENVIGSINMNNIELKNNHNYLMSKSKELFKYESEPPKWLQDEQWPVRNKKYLIFVGQSTDPSSDEWCDEPIIYYFKTIEGEIIKITQLS